MNTEISQRSALVGMGIGVALLLVFVLLALFAKFWDGQQRSPEKPLHKAQQYDVLFSKKLHNSLPDGLRWSGLKLTYVRQHKGKRRLISVRAGVWQWWQNDRLIRKESYCSHAQANRGECLLGRLHGKQQRWFTNGREKKRLSFCDGRPCQKEKQWYSNGQLKLLASYSGGVREGAFTRFWWNGKKSEKGSYHKGVQNGAWSYWYQNGKQRALITWKNGQKHGLFRQWWWLCLPSRCVHRLHKEGYYKSDRKTGLWKTFSLLHRDSPPENRHWTTGGAQ